MGSVTVTHVSLEKGARSFSMYMHYSKEGSYFIFISHVSYMYILALFMLTFVLQDGNIPLMIATVGDHYDVAKTLVKAGADIRLTDKV